MRADGYSIGGEQSGHVIFLDYNSTGDGLLTAVQMLALLKKSGQPFIGIGKSYGEISAIAYQRSCSNKNGLG